MKLQFYLRFHTRYGQSLWLTGNAEELGNNDIAKAVPLVYLNDEFWTVSIDVKRKNFEKSFRYKYLLKNEDGELLNEWGYDRTAGGIGKEISEIHFTDTWNHAGEYENAFFTAPFEKVLLRRGETKIKPAFDKHATHVFRVKAPLLKKGEAICICGNGVPLGDWNTEKPILLTKEGNWWTTKLDLSAAGFPIAYKYGIYNVNEKRFVQYESGNNRLLYSDVSKGKYSILHDGFVQLPNTTGKDQA
jgi:4-alpha-glucanotransferase